MMSKQDIGRNTRGGTLVFLNGAESLPFTSEQLRELARGHKLSEEDSKILEEILGTVAKENRLPFSWTPQEADYLNSRPQSAWIDYLVYRFKFRCFPDRKIVSKFPVYLLIEPVSACNLRCVMCFQTDKSFTRKDYMGVMDLALFKEIVDQAVEGGTQAITLGSRGEPLLHDRFIEILQYLKGKFVEVKVVTNATHLSMEYSHALLQNGVDLLVFSIDTADRDLYEKIRIRGDFDKVVENIRRFQQIRREEYPQSNISTRVAGVKVFEEQDAKIFHEFWRPYVDQVGLKDAFERWNTYENPPHPEQITPCYLLWERMYIWFDGICNPCDSDYKSKLAVGNVKDSSIRKIWNGERMQKLRDIHQAGERADYIPCDRCGI